MNALEAVGFHMTYPFWRFLAVARQCPGLSSILHCLRLLSIILWQIISIGRHHFVTNNNVHLIHEQPPLSSTVKSQNLSVWDHMDRNSPTVFQPSTASLTWLRHDDDRGNRCSLGPILLEAVGFVWHSTLLDLELHVLQPMMARHDKFHWNQPSCFPLSVMQKTTADKHIYVNKYTLGEVNFR